MEIVSDVQQLQQELERERKARQEAEQLADRIALELAAVRNNLPDPESGYAHPVLRLALTGEILYTNAAGKQLLNTVPVQRIPAFKRLLLNKAVRLQQPNPPAFQEMCKDGRYFLLYITALTSREYFNFYLTDITERRLAEKALKESQQFVNNITHTIPNIIYIYDIEEDRSIYLNRQISSMLGYTEADIAAMDGHVFLSIVEPEDRDMLNQHVASMQTAADGEVRQAEYNVRAKDGEVKILYCRESVFKRKRNGQVKQIIGSAEDITRLRFKSMELARQKDFYESILNHIPSDVAVYDHNMRYKFVNPAAVGDPFIREWIIDKTNEEYCEFRNVPLHRVESRGRHLRMTLEEKKRVEFEEKLIDKEGNPSYHIRKLNPVLDEQGDVKLIIGHGITITELHNAQEEIRQSEAKNRAILAAMPDLMFIIDRKGVLLEMHNGNEAHLKLDQDKVIGRTLDDVLPATLSQSIQELLQKALETGLMERIDFHLDLSAGTRYYEGRSVKYNEDQVLTIMRDTTEERKVAQEIKEKNDFISLVLNTSPSLIYVKDDSGNFKLANQECAALFGKTIEELVNSNYSDVHAVKQEVDYYNALDRQVIRTGKEIKVQERFTLPTGAVTWYNTIKKPLVTSDGQVQVLSIATNITEQRLVIKNLERSEELHRLLSENSRDLICLHDLDGTFLYVSKAAKELLGYLPEEITGTSPYALLHPDDSFRVLEKGQNRAIEEKRNIIIQNRLMHRNGTYTWMETSIKPIMNSKGEVVKLQSASRDITDRRLAEEALKNSEKKYRDLINYSQAYICTHDLQGRLLSDPKYPVQYK